MNLSLILMFGIFFSAMKRLHVCVLFLLLLLISFFRVAFLTLKLSAETSHQLLCEVLSSTDEEDLSIASCGSGVLMTFPEVAHSMLSLCSSRRSRQDRSPSVEIIYEGTITADGAQPPAHKRRRKRHRKAQQSRYEVSHCWEGEKRFVLARYTNSYS